MTHIEKARACDAGARVGTTGRLSTCCISTGVGTQHLPGDDECAYRLDLRDAQRADRLTADRKPREAADDYPNIVARLSDKWRVILCPAGTQWIVQRRDGERAGGARWASVGYCQTREALLRLCRASCGPVSPSIREVLGSLPDHITRGQQ